MDSFTTAQQVFQAWLNSHAPNYSKRQRQRIEVTSEQAVDLFLADRPEFEKYRIDLEVSLTSKSVAIAILR